MLGSDEYFLHRVQHPHLSEVGTCQGQNQVIVDHLLLVLLGLGDKLVSDHIAQQRLIEIRKNKLQTG